MFDTGAYFPTVNRSHVKAYLPHATDSIRFIRLHLAGRRIDRQMDTGKLAELIATSYTPNTPVVDLVITRSLTARPVNHSGLPLSRWLAQRQARCVPKCSSHSAHLPQMRRGSFHPRVRHFTAY